MREGEPAVAGMVAGGDSSNALRGGETTLEGRPPPKPLASSFSILWPEPKAESLISNSLGGSASPTVPSSLKGTKRFCLHARQEL